MKAIKIYFCFHRFPSSSIVHLPREHANLFLSGPILDQTLIENMPNTQILATPQHFGVKFAIV